MRFGTAFLFVLFFVAMAFSQTQQAVAVAQNTNQVVYVIGAVQKPGVYQLGINPSALRILALSGGLETKADLKSAKIIRNGPSTTTASQAVTAEIALDYQAIINGQAPDIQHLSGDVVYIPGAVQTK